MANRQPPPYAQPSYSNPANRQQPKPKTVTPTIQQQQQPKLSAPVKSPVKSPSVFDFLPVFNLKQTSIAHSFNTQQVPPFRNYIKNLKSPIVPPTCVMNPSYFYQQTSANYAQKGNLNVTKDNNWLKDEVKNERKDKFYSYPKFDVSNPRFSGQNANPIFGGQIANTISYPAEPPPNANAQQQQQQPLAFTQVQQQQPQLQQPWQPIAFTQIQQQQPQLQQPWQPLAFTQDQQQQQQAQLQPQAQLQQQWQQQVVQSPVVQQPIGLNGLDKYSKRHDSVKTFLARHASQPGRDAEYMSCFQVLWAMGFMAEEKVVPVIARYGPDPKVVAEEYKRRFPRN